MPAGPLPTTTTFWGDALGALCDVASPEFHPMVERAKDVAAGAVLVSAAGALVVGLLLFGPRLLALVG